MPKLTDNKVPSYRLRKRTGQAIVTLNGHDVPLGKHGTAASRTEYQRVIAEWLANNRRPVVRQADGLSVNRLIVEFWAHAKGYYRGRDGGPGRELLNFKHAMIPLRRLYGETPAADFGPLALRAVQEEMVRMGWCRKVINRQVGRVRHVFKWGESRQLIPASVHHALTTVPPLKRGKTAAPESPGVKPVAEAHVAKTLPFMSRQVQAMVTLELLCGMRPGEVVIMRGCDLDTTGKRWVYRPHYHKNDQHDIRREIPIGPRGRALIEQFWKTDTQAYLFSPADALAEIRAARAKDRKTALSCGNSAGTKTTAKPKWATGDRYTVNSYRQAIVRACDEAYPPPADLARIRMPRADGKRGGRWETDGEWEARLGTKRWAELQGWVAAHRWCPLQVRHTTATKWRREFGVDLAQGLLGHRLGSNITEVYAEADAERIAEIVEQVG